jgi:hypothetical protein
MATLGTQLISTSYTQLIKTLGTGGLDGSLQVITDGDDTQSALSLSTSAVSSTGSFSVVGASTFTGSVTFSTSITASSGTTTIGTAAITTATIGTQNVTISTVSTSTIGTLTVTSHTATNSTVTSTATVGTLRVGAAGPKLTAVSYGTAAFTLSTVSAHNVADTTTGTFALTGCALGDIVFGSINTLGAATGTICLAVSFYPQTTDVARYSIINKGATAGTISAGTIFATAMRFTT